MQAKFPHIYNSNESIYGESLSQKQHPMGTELMSYFDDDVNQPMYCEVLGSRWKTDEYGMGIPGNKQPMYVIEINGDISQIYLTSAHEEGGWFVRKDTDNPKKSSEDEKDRNEIPNEECIPCPPSSDGSKINVTEYISNMSRESIQCDAPNCTQMAPAKRCSKCCTVYYCSQECQRRHWKEHKSDCRDIKVMQSLTLGLGDGNNVREKNELDQFHRNQSITTDDQQESMTTECSICLSENPTNPVVLPACKHVFCYSCLEEWKTFHKYNDGSNTSICPYCRTEMPPDLKSQREIYIDRVRFLGSKASSKGPNSKERYEYCDKAFDVMNELQTLEQHDDNDIQILCTKAQILALDNRKVGLAAKCFEKAIELNEQNTQNAARVNHLLDQVGIAMELGDETEAEFLMNQVESITKGSYEEQGPMSRVSDPFQLRLYLAAAYMSDRNWAQAMETFQSILQEMYSPTIGTPPQQRQVFMGMSQCLYELGQFDECIEIGQAALEMNRHYPQAHKYVALGYKALGDVENALRTLEQGVLYETPWDLENVRVVIEQLEAMKSSFKTNDVETDDFQNDETSASHYKNIKVDGYDDDDFSESSYESEEEIVQVWKCECCKKIFKSEAQFDNHLFSKKHKKMMKKWNK